MMRMTKKNGALWMILSWDTGTAAPRSPPRAADEIMAIPNEMFLFGGVGEQYGSLYCVICGSITRGQSLK